MIGSVVPLLKNFIQRFWCELKTHPYAHAILFAIFTAVHAIFYAADGRFDCETFSFWQVLDLDLLQNHLLESVWYLHSQPPLFNFFLGVVQKWAWGFDRAVYHAVYLMLGLSTAFCIFHLQLRFRVATPIALGLTCLCLLSPSWLLYEHWFMYTFPVMALLSFAALRLHRYLESKTIRDGILFFTLLLLLVYLRSMFHFLWVFITLLILLPVFWKRKSILFKAAVIPCCLVVLLFAKNAYLFGTWSSSTWLGPNLMRMAYIVPANLFRESILNGSISRYALIHPFVPLKRYQGEFGFDPTKTWGIPALDQKTKKDGDPNFNNGHYAAFNQQYLKDAVTLIRQSPRDYWTLVQQSWRRFCQPAWVYQFFRGQTDEFDAHMAKWTHWIHGWDETIYEEHLREVRVHPRRNLFFWLLPVSIVAGIVAAASPRRFGFSLSSTDRTTLVFCLFTILLVIFSGTFCMRTENYRVRYLLTPYFTLLAGIMLDRSIFAFRTVLKRIRQSFQPTPNDSVSDR